MTNTQASPDDRFSRSALNTAQNLTRKKISLSYHTQMPAFLRAEGPFHIYDHALRYPRINNSDKRTDCDKVTSNALARYEHQITDLQRLREKEKEQFYQSMRDQDIRAQAKYE